MERLRERASCAHVALCVLYAWAGVLCVLFLAAWPNPVSYYMTYDPAAALRLGAEPLEFLGDVAWAVRPRNANRHMVVMVHGRSGNFAQNVPLARALVAKGHGVLLFDMPRSGTGLFPKLGAQTWGAMAFDHDARWAVFHALGLAQGLAGGAPLALYGHSLGGVYALQVADLPCVDVVITDGTPFSLLHAVLGSALPPAVLRPVKERTWLWPFEMPGREVWAFTLPTESECERPPFWLGLHASGDDVVPITHLEQLRERTAGAWRGSRLVPLGGSHWEPERLERARAILDALQSSADAPGV